MAMVDPFAPLRDWRTSLFRGSQGGICGFLYKIDAKLPSEWVRDNKYETTRSRPDRIRCFLFDRVPDAAVRVWLQLVTETRVRGGPVQVIRHPGSGGSERIGELVDSFADRCVFPAARAAGALSTRPRFGPRSALSPATEMLFTRFADTADGEWPLTNRTQVLWDELISGCLADQVAIDRDELRQWLEDSGWESRNTEEIVDRFFRDSEWLARRLAIMVP